MTEFNKYRSEVKERWGSTEAYAEHLAKTGDYSEEKWSGLAGVTDRIMADFALCMKSGASPDSQKAQELVRNLQAHITESYYRCTDEILYGLGQMYVCDERFTKNIDRHGDGTAEFIRDAITVYCGKDM